MRFIRKIMSLPERALVKLVEIIVSEMIKSQSAAPWSNWARELITYIDPSRPMPASDEEARVIIETWLERFKKLTSARAEISELQRRVSAMTASLRG